MMRRLLSLAGLVLLAALANALLLPSPVETAEPITTYFNGLAAAGAPNTADRLIACQAPGCTAKTETIAQILSITWSVTLYTSNTTPVTLAATNFLEEVINQGTPAALTVDLPPNPTTGLYECVKDGGNNFAQNPATVATTDGSTIDGNSGANGLIMMNKNQEACFMYIGGSKWIVK